MSESEALLLLQEVLAHHTGMTPAEIHPELRVVEDLGLDSIDAVELLISLERRVGIRFEAEHLEDLDTVADVAARMSAASRVAG